MELMTTTTDTPATAVLAGQTSVESGEPKAKGAGQSPPRAIAALRSMGVVLGPAVALDLALAGSLAAAAATALRPAGAGRLGRVLRPLAGVGTLAAAAYAAGFRPWLLRWGVTDDELRRSLPGDELIPRPMFEANRAVTIDAPPEAVWPWLVQIGTGRAGWYSYDFLENLSGIEVHSEEQIIPDLQNLRVSDQVFIAPGYGFIVAEIIPARALVLRSFNPVSGSPTDLRAGDTIDITWAFVLDAAGPSGTRLIARYRADGRPRRGTASLMVHLVEIPHFVMERQMLLGIKRRAERGRSRRPLTIVGGGVSSSTA